MKSYILYASLGAAFIASCLGVAAVLTQNVGGGAGADAVINSYISSVRLYQLAGISGLFSIASFFVGLAFPATVTQSHDVTTGATTQTAI